MTNVINWTFIGICVAWIVGLAYWALFHYYNGVCGIFKLDCFAVAPLL